MRTFVTVLTLALLAAAPASAQAPTVRLHITSAGLPDAFGAQQWQVCPPAEECRRIYSGRDGFDIPAGARFEGLSATGAVLRSAVWGGTVTATAPPAVTGPAVVRGRVSVTPGTWKGGWGDEVDKVTAVACQAPDTPRWLCRALPTRRGDPAGTFVIHDDLAGFYLQAVHSRMARDGSGGSSLASRGDLASRSPGVRIEAAPPVVELRRRATRSSLGYGVGHVRCFPTCSVQVAVSGAGRKATHTLTGRNRTALVLPRSAKLRPGLLRVRVTVDGTQRADGFVRLAR